MKMFDQAFFFPEDDLFGIPKNMREKSEKWQRINQNFKEVLHEDKDSIN